MRLACIVVAIFCFCSIALVVAALTLETWVTGSSAFFDIEVGLLKQCVNDNCFDILPQDMNNKWWQSCFAFLLIGGVLFGVAAVFALMSECCTSLYNAVKIMVWTGAFFILLGVLLVPVGWRDLDHSCPDGTEEGQCGLICGSGGKFSAYNLCSPWETGQAFHIACAGAGVAVLAVLSCLALTGAVVIVV
eukprot:m.213922 g.213922  ORF g.213922 m.213922 type:complete len:190 (+) comp22179_c5_seq1:101-670(+)